MEGVRFGLIIRNIGMGYSDDTERKIDDACQEKMPERCLKVKIVKMKDNSFQIISESKSKRKRTDSDKKSDPVLMSSFDFDIKPEILNDIDPVSVSPSVTNLNNRINSSSIILIESDDELQNKTTFVEVMTETQSTQTSETIDPKLKKLELEINKLRQLNLELIENDESKNIIIQKLKHDTQFLTVCIKNIKDKYNLDDEYLSYID